MFRNRTSSLGKQAVLYARPVLCRRSLDRILGFDLDLREAVCERQGYTRRFVGLAARSRRGDEILLAGDRRSRAEIGHRFARRGNRDGSAQIRG